MNGFRLFAEMHNVKASSKTTSTLLTVKNVLPDVNNTPERNEFNAK